jgi:hypothetical protein
MKQLVVLTLAVGLLVLAGCKKDASGSVAMKEAKGTAAGLSWGVPQRWAVGPVRQMREATYLIPAAEGDPEGAECAVFHFGPDAGGDVTSNIDRWVGQFEPTSGPDRSSKQVNGMEVTTVRIGGAYLNPSGPMMQSTGKKPGYRLLGAIVAGPQGSVFFKMTGPEKTIAATEGEFEALVGSLSK